MDKNHILAEIRRTAAANNGVPLGRMRFYNETGIKEADWSGKYWIRWSDALKEAGFTPNPFQSAYQEEYLLEKLVFLIRELGHFPVRNEMRMKANQDDSFPNDKTFARLGSKQKLVDKLLKFCKAHEGYEDIAPVCASLIKLDKVAIHDQVSVSDGVFGFVYLLKSGKFFKIGRSNALERREWELSIQLPEPANLVHAIKTDDPIGIEQYWHKRFENRRCRKKAEWFDLTTQDIAAFRRRKFM